LVVERFYGSEFLCLEKGSLAAHRGKLPIADFAGDLGHASDKVSAKSKEPTVNASQPDHPKGKQLQSDFKTGE
jgi:hypothetical protein